MKAVKIRPVKSYKQGDFDALCGVYSLVNIVQYMTMATKPQLKVLFINALKYLEVTQKMKLRAIIKNGLTFKDIQSLFSHFLPQFDIEYYVPFQKNSYPTIDEYWIALQVFLNSSQRTCVFLRITGRLNHWTVARSVSTKVMYFVDSGSLKLVSKRYCGIHKIDADTAHQLWASQTLFMTNKKNGSEIP